ncbi:hypothetical protein [Kutzneria sp. CA-103260]|uniref:hypothetical protein n=1 Tax=Kutzneria sp. CA-103260 TaxID=2802641 RepID=UPI001BAB4E4C|nr:hypothetical protein [Kutzneria sp. CA-103260]QUQ67526.1 hypothetical protein JJ691_52610 [Kutzneria sp. CA-103260]
MAAERTGETKTRGSEEILRRALAKLGARDRIVLASKVNVRMGGDPNAAGNHRRHVIEQCHASPGGCVVPYYLDDATADFRPHAFRW